MQWIWTIFLESWMVLGQMAPYLLLGFLVAGILSVAISPRFIERHLGGRGLGAAFKASLFGVPLPLCSCGVIPVAASLRQHGASKSATAAFLLSTPQTGVDSMAVTYALLGPVFAVFRPVAALVTGLIGGGLVGWLDCDDPVQASSTAAAGACTAKGACTPAAAGPAWQRALQYAFLTLPRDIGKALFVGILIAGVIGAFVPPDYFALTLGCGFAAMLVMMLIGIPLYVCATGSVPIAAAFLAKGFCPGAALVFLIAGPATNAATITTLWKTLGKRSAFLYLATVAGCALLAGVAMNGLIGPGAQPAMHEHAATAAGWWFQQASAVVLLGVLMLAHWPRSGRKDPAALEKANDMELLPLQIDGMTCSHCVQTVARTLRECDGVARADVRLEDRRADVYGRGLDADRLKDAVSAVGYEARGPEE